MMFFDLSTIEGVSFTENAAAFRLMDPSTVFARSLILEAFLYLSWRSSRVVFAFSRTLKNSRMSPSRFILRML